MTMHCRFVFLVVIAITTHNSWANKETSRKDRNVCRHVRVKTTYVMRKNITTTTKYITKKCGIPSNPNLVCPETRVCSVIYWYPHQKRQPYYVYRCCPGWTGYSKEHGCQKKIGCHISLPQYDEENCQRDRKVGIMRNRYFYKLSKPVPMSDPERKPSDLSFPMLGQPTQKVVTKCMLDKFSAHWCNLYFHGMLKRNNVTAAKIMAAFKEKTFDSYQDYADVYNAFIKATVENPLPYFKLPSTAPGYPTITEGNKWKEDKYFVEQRLAGLNPMQLQRVTMTGEVGINWEVLNAKLNPKFGWEAAVKRVIGEGQNLKTAIENGLVYAIEYPMYNEIPHVQDIMDPDLQDERVMRNSTSPIALFAVGKSDTGAAELKVVAIQMDYSPDSPVYTPDDGLNWSLAKAMVQTADFAIVEIYHHLLRTHVRMEPYCVCFYRHLSEKHPLMQVLKYHCRGMIPVNNYGFPKLTNQQAYMHKLFAMGHIGTFKILNIGYQSMRWGDDDTYEDLRKRGVDDATLLPYYPYRDDAKIIYNCLKEFAKDLVEAYYKTDDDVRFDTELQSLMNELSADGTLKPDGGNGMVKGLASSVNTKSELASFLLYALLPIPQHTAVNYPIMEYGAFTPNMPTKLYNDPREHETEPFFYTLPGKNISILQGFVSVNLGTIRYDKLFDYYKELEDEEGRNVVYFHYKKLMDEIKPMMVAQNSERVRQGHLSYPYLIPGWIPNSIHT